VALGGVGYAAATGSIDSRELKNNSVASGDIKNNSLVGKDVKTSSLTGSDVKSGSLTGSDVLESSLTRVPSAGQADSATSAQNATNATNATNAGNAATVGGQRVIPFVYRNDSTTADTVVAEVGGLRVELSCAGGDTDLMLTNISGAPAEVNYGATHSLPTTPPVQTGTRRWAPTSTWRSQPWAAPTMAPSDRRAS